jgi:hypothetical protein
MFTRRGFRIRRVNVASVLALFAKLRKCSSTYTRIADDRLRCSRLSSICASNCDTVACFAPAIPLSVGGCNADNQACGRNDAIIGPERRRPQPTDAVDKVPLRMQAKTAHPQSACSSGGLLREPGRSAIRDTRVTCTIGYSVHRGVTAESEVGRTDAADGPATFARR